MITATRDRPILGTDISRLAGTRVRMVVMENEQLDRDVTLVGDLVAYVKRVDLKGAGEAILIDALDKGWSIALRRIRSIEPYGLAPPLWKLTRDPEQQQEAARLTRHGGHLDVTCRRCRRNVERGKPHLSECKV